MKAFLNHYFLVTSWGQPWFDTDRDLFPQIEENENLTEKVWSYSPMALPVTFDDVVKFDKGEITDSFKNWIRYIVAFVGTVAQSDKGITYPDDSTVLMSSMGCGSSDYLTITKVKKFLLDHPEVADFDKEYHTSAEWNAKDVTTIMDPDGWDRKNYEWSFNHEYIDKDEYERRLRLSTISVC